MKLFNVSIGIILILSGLITFILAGADLLGFDTMLVVTNGSHIFRTFINAVFIVSGFTCAFVGILRYIYYTKNIFSDELFK